MDQPLVNYAVNIGWNSNAWRGLPKPGEGENFEFVARGGIPGESWNFDFGNRRNTRTVVYGYAPRIERARKDAGNMFLVAKAPEGKRFVVGLYHKARILKSGPPWRFRDSPAPSGRDAYVNLAVERAYAVNCANPRLLSWNPARYYHTPYRRRQWPGRQNFLVLPDAGVRRLLLDVVVAHERWGRTNPADQALARRVVSIARAWLGGKAPRRRTPSPPPVSTAVPTVEVVKAERRKVAAERLLRNAPQLRALKDAYGYLCQVDLRHRVDLPDPPPYIEVHHLRPVAEGGVLVDPSFSNCLVVCPSCHILLQNGALWIDPVDGRTVRHFAHDRRYEARRLRLLRGHRLNRAVLRRLAPPKATRWVSTR